MNVTHLECGLCGLRHEAGVLQNLCVECGKPLLARYDLDAAAAAMKVDAFAGESSLWRYRQVLPVADESNIVSFGEGWTPLLRADRLASSLPIKIDLFIKDEGQNPTQSFKARGMTAAISMATGNVNSSPAGQIGKVFSVGTKRRVRGVHCHSRCRPLAAGDWFLKAAPKPVLLSPQHSVLLIYLMPLNR